MKLKWQYLIGVTLFFAAMALLLLQLLQHSTWLFLFGEILLLTSAIAFFVLYKKLVKPVDTISSAIHMLHARDFNTRMALVGQREIDALIKVYNEMSGQLREERIKHEEKNLFLHRLIQASPSAIIIMGAHKEISRMNPVASALLEIASPNNGSLPLELLSPNWRNWLENIIPGESQMVKPDGVRRYRINCGSFMDRGFARHFFIVEELTHELYHAERHAYEKVIRTMSHEVNNSVGAVNSVMQSVLNLTPQLHDELRDDVVEALTISIQRNERLNQFMANFAHVVKLPPPQKVPVKVNALLKRMQRLFCHEAERSDIAIALSLDDEVNIMADVTQMEQVLVNIIRNSMEAVGSQGNILLISKFKSRQIMVEDDGSGIEPSMEEKLFIPFSSSKKTGQGIGLTLVREILMNHDFEFSLRTNSDGITRFSISFPE